MRGTIAGVAACAALAACALPTVQPESVTFTQDEATGKVTIGYTLEGDPGVVTVDVTTNGVSIGGEHLRRLGGDVNRKIKTTGAKTITWIPDSGMRGFALTNDDVRVVVTAWPTNNLPDYLVVDLSMYGKYYFYPNEGQLPHGVSSHVYKTDQLVMRKIHAAGQRFRMGSPSTETGRTDADEKIHYVSFTNDFYLGIYELTKGQAKALIFEKAADNASGAELPHTAEYDEYPYEGIPYDRLRGSTSGWPQVARGGGSTSFAAPHARQVSGLCVDLPTDAEWEFACRAGESAARYDGTDDDSTLTNLAWYSANADGTMHPVGLKQPNAWGLYDMYGNAREWTLVWYERYDLNSEQIDPPGWTGKNSGGYNADQDGNYNRVARGGSYASAAAECRSASRQKTHKDTTVGMGMRLWCKAVIP